MTARPRWPCGAPLGVVLEEREIELGRYFRPVVGQLLASRPDRQPVGVAGEHAPALLDLSLGQLSRGERLDHRAVQSRGGLALPRPGVDLSKPAVLALFRLGGQRPQPRGGRVEAAGGEALQQGRGLPLDVDPDARGRCGGLALHAEADGALDGLPALREAPRHRGALEARRRQGEQLERPLEVVRRLGARLLLEEPGPRRGRGVLERVVRGHDAVEELRRNRLPVQVVVHEEPDLAGPRELIPFHEVVDRVLQVREELPALLAEPLARLHVSRAHGLLAVVRHFARHRLEPLDQLDEMQVLQARGRVVPVPGARDAALDPAARLGRGGADRLGVVGVGIGLEEGLGQPEPIRVALGSDDEPVGGHLVAVGLGAATRTLPREEEHRGRNDEEDRQHDAGRRRLARGFPAPPGPLLRGGRHDGGGLSRKQHLGVPDLHDVLRLEDLALDLLAVDLRAVAAAEVAHPPPAVAVRLDDRVLAARLEVVQQDVAFRGTAEENGIVAQKNRPLFAMGKDLQKGHAMLLKSLRGVPGYLQQLHLRVQCRPRDA